MIPTNVNAALLQGGKFKKWGKLWNISALVGRSLSLSFSVLAQNGERAEKSIRISIQSQDEEDFDILMDRSHQATKLEY